MPDRKLHLGCSLILVLLVSSAALHAAERSGPSESLAVDTLARRAISLLAAGDYDGIAELHHYPPSYPPVERKKDKAEVANGLRFVFAEAGKMSEVRPLEQSGEFYFISMGGGDVPYWQSMSPYGRREYPYHVKFSTFGDAMVKVVVLMTGPLGGRELVGVDLGLSTKKAGAKDVLISLSLDLLRELKVETPPNIKELVSQGMEPRHVGPASSR